MPARIGEWREVGPECATWLARHGAVSVLATVSFDFVIDESRGEGCTLFDADGNEFLDFGMVGADNFGFGSCARKMDEAVRALAVKQLPEYDIANKLGTRAKELLVSRTPLYGPGIATAMGSGSDANEWALDIAIQHDVKRRVFACFEGAFHGRNHGIRTALDPRKPERIAGFGAPYRWIRLRFPSLSLPDPVAVVKEDFYTLLHQARRDVNALFLECIQGEGGVNVADAEALQFLAEFCREDGILLVVDEVQSGMGRTGTLWSYEQFGFLPDIVTMGKSLGGGVRRLAAVVARADLNFKVKGQRSSTFGFEPADAAAFIAAMETLDAGLLERGKRMGVFLQRELKKRLGGLKYVKDAGGGLGLMRRLEFWRGKKDAKPYPELRDKVWKNAAHLGLLSMPSGFPGDNPAIRLMPPLVITEREIATGVEILYEAYRKAVAELQ